MLPAHNYGHYDTENQNHNKTVVIQQQEQKAAVFFYSPHPRLFEVVMKHLINTQANYKHWLVTYSCKTTRLSFFFNPQFKQVGSECRPSAGDCDLPEYCTGVSQHCPEDSFEMNGKPCYNKAQGYCYDGQCPTHEHHCWRLFGPGTSSNSTRTNTVSARASPFLLNQQTFLAWRTFCHQKLQPHFSITRLYTLKIITSHNKAAEDFTNSTLTKIDLYISNWSVSDLAAAAAPFRRATNVASAWITDSRFTHSPSKFFLPFLNTLYGLSTRWVH